ncbi:hypothetical protein OBV_05700 [Oscillibacter valericigenes Sjm18-20]|nr:hypothetical protein OBV_05700 [Oscillibacter valericigenes Sjm18-20]
MDRHPCILGNRQDEAGHVKWRGAGVRQCPVTCRVALSGECGGASISDGRRVV